MFAGMEESGPSDLWNGTREPSRLWINHLHGRVNRPWLKRRPSRRPRRKCSKIVDNQVAAVVGGLLLPSEGRFPFCHSCRCDEWCPLPHPREAEQAKKIPSYIFECVYPFSSLSLLVTNRKELPNGSFSIPPSTQIVKIHSTTLAK